MLKLITVGGIMFLEVLAIQKLVALNLEKNDKNGIVELNITFLKNNTISGLRS